MQVKPLSDRVLVKPMAKDEVTQSGIVIPDTVEKERPERGEVIATGPGKRLDNGELAPIPLKVGDKVMFRKYGPDEVEIEGEKMLVLEERDIIAVLEE